MSSKLNLIMGARNGAKQEREKLDFYATNPQAVRLFLNSAFADGLKFNTTIWECACGNGHISEVLKEYGFNVVNSDIVKRDYDCVELDFLKATSEDRAELCPNGCDIMTNPPFKNAVAFVRKGLELLREKDSLILFLKFRFLEGVERLKLFREYNPHFVYAHSSRQKCALNGEFDKYCQSSPTEFYAWFIFEKGYKGETILKWIDYQYRKEDIMSKYTTITIVDFYGETHNCNCETVGRSFGGYLNYFNCGICKNQSVGDDKPFYCNNQKFLQDSEDKKQYCANYERDFDYMQKNNIKV